MTTVEHLYVEPKPEARALKRIRLLSLPFEITFAVLAVAQLGLLLLILSFFFIGDGQALRVHPGGAAIVTDPALWPADSVAVRDLPLLAQVYGAGAVMLLAGSMIAAFACLVRLFDDYRRGVVFASSTMAWMRRAGVLLVVAGLGPAALQPITQALGLLDSNWFNDRNLAAALIGAALVVLSYVVELGRDIEAEIKDYV